MGNEPFKKNCVEGQTFMKTLHSTPYMYMKIYDNLFHIKNEKLERKNTCMENLTLALSSCNDKV